MTNNNRNERGASLVEYALLVALISLVCIISVQILGTRISNTFDKVVACQLNNVCTTTTTTTTTPN